MKLFIYRIFLNILDILKRIRRNKADQRYAPLKESFIHNWAEIEKGNTKSSLIIFASAIGEFNAIRPFIDSYLACNKDSKLIILSHDLQYSSAYNKAYPFAVVGLMPVPVPRLFDELAFLVKPDVVAIAEGPCLFCHFPLRLDLSLAAMCLYHKIPLIILNATPWPKQFISRIYKIEYFLFHDIFRRAVTIWFTPYEEFKGQLKADGVPENKIKVVGDMKYDVDYKQPLKPVDHLAGLLEIFEETPEQPLIVAGSVSSFEEQMQIISAWTCFKEKYPKAKLVLAPRQVNQYAAMVPLKEFLRTSCYNYAFRSSCKDIIQNPDLLVLDVYGELMHFYRIASLCFIGRNHGVLEPLKFEKPTLVGPAETWDHDKPTYCMYKQHVSCGTVSQVTDMRLLGNVFIKLLEDKSKQTEMIKNTNDLFLREKGASQKIINYISTFGKEVENV